MKLYKLTLAAILLLAFALSASAQTTLRIFTGGQQRPDVMRKIADEYQKKNPNVKVEVEVGGLPVVEQHRPGRRPGRSAPGPAAGSRSPGRNHARPGASRCERRHHFRGAAAIPLDGALFEGFGARCHPYRRHPTRAVGGTRLGRAARFVPGRRQGEDHGAVSESVRRRRPGQRQAHCAAILCRFAVPLLPQGSAREIQASDTEDLGRDDGHRQGDHGRREELESAGVLDRRRADRRHCLHLPRSPVGRGWRTDPGRQAQSRCPAGT